METFNNSRIMFFAVALVILSGKTNLATSIRAVEGHLPPPMDCLEANKHCFSDVNCKKEMDILSSVCDQKENYCRDHADSLCEEVVTSLQTSAYFHRCTCRTKDSEDLVLCQTVQRRIHDHPCSRHSDYEYREDYEDERADGCTRVRKKCLQDNKCEGVLRTYRIKCSESKRQQKCTSLDREGCFDAIKQMESLIPDLFTCGCEQKDPHKRTRCERIQYRLAKNKCRVDVPYYIHSRQTHEATFETLVSIVEETFTVEAKHREKDFPGISIVDKSTCPRAFKECNADSSCHLQMANFMTTCVWRKTNTCDRRACLEGIKEFFVYIRPRLAQDLLFCQCKKGDAPCEAVKQALYPTCSLIQTPAPSCLDIMQHCKADADCSMRYEAYETNCGFHLGHTLCPNGPSMCRNAMLGIMGTILMTNCTCPMSDPEQHQFCMDTRWRLQGYSICKRDAISHFHMGDDVTQVYMDSSSSATRKEECRRKLGESLPKYYDTPVTVRKYDNKSTCSELCTCLHNGTLLCKVLPCRLELSCKHNHLVYVHGKEFSPSAETDCRCIRGETVCGLSASAGNLGLFLHLGLSVSEKNLIEENSDVRVDKNSLTRKLATILNSDSAEQYCSLKLYHATDSHLVMRVEVSQHNHKQDSMESCLLSAKKLAYKVNDRYPVIIKDAELSVVKVAQLENISEDSKTTVHVEFQGELGVDVEYVIPDSLTATPAGQATFNSVASHSCLPCQILYWCLTLAVVMLHNLDIYCKHTADTSEHG